MKQAKLKPIGNFPYRLMMAAYKISSPFCSVQRQIKLLNLEKGMIVVDYGCGPGRHTIPVAQLVGEKGKVYAIDIHPLAIGTVEKKAKENGLKNIEPVLIDSYETDIDDSSVDLILLIDTLPIIKDPKPLLQEVRRILKSKGRIYISHSHLSMAKTRKIVEDSDLFKVSECKVHDMMIVPL